MKKHAQIVSVVAVALLFVLGLFITRSKAEEVGGLTVGSLTGKWQLTFVGVTGCGFSTDVSYITLASNGVGTSSNRGHSSGCPDGTSNTQFTVQSLSPNGSGTANLSCGTGCGWNLIIQVSKNGEMFNFVDVDPVNPGNYIEGTAVRQGE